MSLLVHPLRELVSVQDGDTITARWDPPPEAVDRFRLAYIDAPERGEPLWPQSRLALWELCQDAELHVKLADHGTHHRCSVNRQLVLLYAGLDCINLAMIRLGMAVYTPKWAYPPDHPNWQKEHLMAQEARRGVHAIPSHPIHARRIGR